MADIRSVRTVLSTGRRAALRLVTFLALCLSAPASALILGCQLTGATTLQPLTPGPNDVVGYSVSLHPTTLIQYPYIYVSSLVYFPTSRISIVVIVSSTEDPTLGFRVVPPAFDRPFGTLNPLPVGSYSVASRVLAVNETTGAVEEICPPREPIAYTVNDVPGEAITAPVVEFYNAALDRYFITQNPVEIDKLDRGSAWVRTGHGFLAYVAGHADGRGQGVKRYYGLPAAGLDSHLFTWSSVEPTNSDHWQFESGNAFQIDVPDRAGARCPPSTTPVFRLWNGRRDSAHRYTTSRAVKQEMIALGYIPEGYGPDAVVMCSPRP